MAGLPGVSLEAVDAADLWRTLTLPENPGVSVSPVTTSPPPRPGAKGADLGRVVSGGLDGPEAAPAPFPDVAAHVVAAPSS